MSPEDSYIILRKSLDSFSDVALTEFDLIESDDEKQEFSEFVLKKVKEFLNEIAVAHQHEWKKLNPVRARQFQAHAERLSEKKSSGCPPGFQEIDGICVRV
jgi:hypothetical protein